MNDNPDYWDRKEREKTERETNSVALNPHQFGDQLTLFHAPLGQAERGTFNGNPHARLYRAVGVHKRSVGVHEYEGGFGYETPPHEEFHQNILDNVSRPHKDAGHSTNLGIHWQHDLAYAHDYANDLKGGGVHGDNNFPVIIEADHPGHEHVISRDTDWKTHQWRGGRTHREATPPEGMQASGLSSRRNALTGHKKDWALIQDTVGPHEEDDWMVPEVPVRPGAPMRVHAIHTPDPENPGSYIRNPVQFKGIA